MKQEINSKTAAIIIAVLAVVVLGIGYKVFFSRPAPSEGLTVKPGNERFMHPSGPDNPLPGLPAPAGR
jgi:hypothetical protein